MKAILYIDELIYDIKNKSSLELSSINDSESRYRAQVGEDKRDELERCILEASASLSSLLSRILNYRYLQSADNIAGLGDAIEYNFYPSERRQINKLPAFVDLLHAATVNLSMFRYYNTLSMPELANMRESMAKQDIAKIERMAFEKLPPTIPTREDYER